MTVNLLVEKPEYQEKTTDLLQITDKLYHEKKKNPFSLVLVYWSNH